MTRNPPTKHTNEIAHDKGYLYIDNLFWNKYFLQIVEIMGGQSAQCFDHLEQLKYEGRHNTIICFKSQYNIFDLFYCQNKTTNY